MGCLVCVIGVHRPTRGTSDKNPAPLWRNMACSRLIPRGFQAATSSTPIAPEHARFLLKEKHQMTKRRANHEGTIYKRQDGCWVASVTLPGGKRKSFYAQTRQEVAQKLTVGLKARLDGVPLPSDQLKVG